MQSIDGVQVPVVEIADLVVLKILAARSKDLDDVVSLLRMRAESIDVARVRSVLKLLEDALGQSYLLAAFEQCEARAQRLR